MKKIYIILIVIITITQLSYGQNTPWSTSGNIGIGTTSPAASLDIGKLLGFGELATVLARLQEGNTVGTGTYLGVKGYATQINEAFPTINDVKSFSIEHSFYGSTNSSINFLRGLGTIGGSISFATDNNTEKMRIQANGNVGIGTTSPHQRLDLNGGSLAMGDINATGVITFRNDIPVGTAGSVGLSAIDAAGNGNYDGLGLHVSDGLKILSGANTYFTLLTATGNVGIGTSQPDEKLTVNGSIHSKEVKVNTTMPPPDYVFDSTYKLPELSELKTYLDENHHLPEIPSAKEMEKNGINLSEMNLKLLKKVEELTLYLIEKDKEIKELKSQMSTVQKNLKP